MSEEFVSQFKIVDGGNVPLIENDIQRHYDDAERAGVTP